MPRRASPAESRGGGRRSPLRARAEPRLLRGSGAGGGGGGAGAGAGAGRQLQRPWGEERRRQELLWLRTRIGGRDPPLSTWTVAKASADAFTPGRGGRTAVAAAAAAEGARGRGTPDGSGDLAALRGGCGHFYGPGRREACLCGRLLLIFLGARGWGKRLRRLEWAVDGESWAERKRAWEAPSPSSPLALPRRGLRSPGRGPRRPPARIQAPERLAWFCVGPSGRGNAARLTAESEARNPEAATLLRRGPSSRRARRRCGPWIKEEAAWEEEDGGWQERRQLRGD